jgi:hypothetical protein
LCRNAFQAAFTLHWNVALLMFYLAVFIIG